jgi:hypothetical protein
MADYRPAGEVYKEIACLEDLIYGASVKGVLPCSLVIYVNTQCLVTNRR